MKVMCSANKERIAANTSPKSEWGGAMFCLFCCCFTVHTHTDGAEADFDRDLDGMQVEKDGTRVW